jgi:hypothetical protein
MTAAATGTERSIDAGETIVLTVTLKNKWLDGYAVSATLNENSPHIDEADGQANFGDISTGATADNSADTYIFQVDGGILAAAAASFSLDVTATGYVGSEKFTVIVPMLRIDLAQGEQDISIPSLGAGNVGAGDFNGDGIDDILIGAPMQAGGKAYVILGCQQLSGAIDVSQQQNLAIYGASGDELGISLAAGDFNRDGVDDVLVGADNADGLGEARPDAGEAYIILGSPGLSGTVDIALGKQNLTTYGVSGSQNSGHLDISVAAADVNGDAMDDVVVGASYADAPATRGPTPAKPAQ